MVRKSPCGEGQMAGARGDVLMGTTLGFYYAHKLGHNWGKRWLYNDLDLRLYTPKTGPNDSQLSHVLI